MIRILAVVTAVLVLGGCARIQERQAAARAAISAEDDAKCRSYGSQPGSAAYANCRLTLDQNHSFEEAQRQQSYQAMMVAGAQMMTPPPPPPVVYVAPTQTICNRNALNGQVVCNTR